MEDVQLNLVVKLQMFNQHVTFRNMEKSVVGILLHNYVEINLVLISMDLIINLAINKKIIVLLMVRVNVWILYIVANISMPNLVLLEEMDLVYGLMDNVICIEIVLALNLKHIKNVNR